MAEVPSEMANTCPEDEVIVATDVNVLVQYPPGDALNNVVVLPWQRPVMPVMGPGVGFTSTTMVEAQPVEENE